MRLRELASLFTLCRIVGDGETEINGIGLDSRQLRQGDLFVCIPGVKTDGHQYAGQAQAAGAAALVVERELDVALPQLVVKEARQAMAAIASHLYGYPSRTLRVIGVTGTNGKTSTACMIEHLLRSAGQETGLMGNLGVKIGSDLLPVSLNTQESHDLHRYFRMMLDQGASYCAMEVSSMGLAMGRVKGCEFRTAVFTNLTQDHLDDHKTMDNYKAAKGLLFSRLGNGFHAEPEKRRFAVLNADDPVSAEYARLTTAEVITYSLHPGADVYAEEVRVTPGGNRFRLRSFAGAAEISMKLVGKFNVSNALAAAGAALAEGLTVDQVQAGLATMPVVSGRMELVDGGQQYLVIVDYAHTPDGLDNALSTIREFAQGRVITVFGCGGDRDRTKRPIMGRIAAQYSDVVIVTSDNPRSENPESILQEIVPGLQEAGLAEHQYTLLADRKAAIQKAVEIAGPDDVVLIAGKGHETYQIIHGVSYDFDDRIVAREAIRGVLR
ncbi:UDP-N-acetylmuramoyl-L-alanyl-D-glutamate--2,6-diaminopimelate ligase [Paenibacillus sp. y28]|uniref:UDP-N-acetylmuramoyl-L-alanyl-D-glutamate--2, 6-diaminopimelate ligase n=1 Tax=Paenibacillus sp. y28 TaxID=3129110 RepID=UPI003017FC2C